MESLTVPVHNALDAIIQSLWNGDWPVQMTCGEADRVADLFLAVGRVEDAERFLTLHGKEDTVEESHHNYGKTETEEQPA